MRHVLHAPGGRSEVTLHQGEEGGFRASVVAAARGVLASRTVRSERERQSLTGLVSARRHQP